MKTVNFNFYPTLLDTYCNYLRSEDIWEKYWGFSENPPHTPEEFREMQFQNLIDTINRVEGESSLPADRGTCFNEIIDCIIAGHNTNRDDMEIVSDTENITATFNGNTFVFPINVCRDFANIYTRNTLSQYRCEGTIDTPYGVVRLYGHIDELCPFGIHDIKTTGKYEVGKYKHNWQHRIYPYCITQSGGNVSYFEYDILEIPSKNSFEIHKEYYAYNHAKATEQIRKVCVEFIEFLNGNKHLITDKKIFNETDNEK